ncbi:MAG TPA: hypothetical protein GXZ90_04500 [Clostridiales bacterium]|nr:hypothetical protein [Clostridiales bacterium]
MKEVRVTNMTSLFSKEMLIYSLFDLRLQSPLRVVGLIYFILLFFIVGIPIFMISWPPNVYTMFLAMGIPFGGAYLMSKPIWNGKSFLSFSKTHVRYFTRPKILYDWKNRSNNTNYIVKSQILVSRHDDYNELYRLTKEEEALKYG